jgi:hypothetical protein
LSSAVHTTQAGEKPFAIESSFAISKLRLVEEAEVPLEQLQEEIHHQAQHEGERWISWVALSTAMLAVLAAIAALLSGDRANEAMMSQIESSDQWAYYQAKGIKAAVLGARVSREESASEADRTEVARYAKEQSEIEKEARQKQAEARRDFHQHEIFARAVTMFQVAIAVAAISALTRRRRYWVASIAMGAAGGVFLVFGFISR